jgi:hypothetical protein
MPKVIALTWVVASFGPLSQSARAGAWGAGAFQNDDPADWIEELGGAASPATVVAALQASASAKGYIEAPTCSVAVAAAEVVAAAGGRPSKNLPKSATEWVRRTGFKPSSEILSFARKAIDACRNPKNSELYGLWHDAPSTPREWNAALDDLYGRLK